ncbi:MAG: BamA/TamA family outer membrane protein [Vicinamibacterales bacterium]
MRPWRIATTLVAILVVPLCADAQETRAEAIEKQRSEKATQLKTYEPTRLEKTLLYVEESNPLTRLAPYNGFYIQYGYTGKPIGSGSGLGAGWRHNLFNRDARIVFEAGQSMRSYQMVRADFSLPRLLDEKLELGIEGRYDYQPQEDYFGPGLSSSVDDRSNFLYKAPGVQGRAMFAPRRWINTGIRLGWLDVSIDRGKDKRFPSVHDLFAETDAPGLLDQPAFLYNDLFATIDTRDQPGNARAGGYYGVLWRHYNDSDSSRYTFASTEIDLQQFLPIFDKKRVVALRVRLTATRADDGQEVPFYLQPTLGGSDSLRSTGDYRLRDRNVLSSNIEYRWEAFSGLDMALFSDFGTVASRFRDLELSNLRKAYGLGFRFNTYKAVFLRIDIAGGGSEGLHLFTRFSKVF